jgi:hypothetical protein
MTTSKLDCRVDRGFQGGRLANRNGATRKPLIINKIAGFSGFSGGFCLRKLYRVIFHFAPRNEPIICVCVNLLLYIFLPANLENPANARNIAIFRVAGFPHAGDNFPATLQTWVCP